MADTHSISSLPAGCSILGFVSIGLRSHQMLSIKVGRELIARGHKFSILLSAYDEISRAVVHEDEPFQILTFQGHPGNGTHQWAARMPQDPKEVVT